MKAFTTILILLALLACGLGQAALCLYSTLWGALLYAAAAPLLFAARGDAGVAAVVAPAERRGRRLAVATALAFVVWGGALLFYRLDSFPDVVYNWEAYTVHGVMEYMGRPLDFLKDSYLWNESLMTLSQRSLLVAGPILAVWRTFGMDLLQLRVVPVIYGILSVVLMYKLTEAHFGRVAAVIGAVALSTSPVFLLYSRTATNVGPSILPSLLVVYCFAGAISGKKRYFPLLGFCLGIASYYYAVIRFLPLSVLVVMAGLLLSRRLSVRRYGWPLLAMVAVMLLTVSPQLLNPQNLLDHYFSARGEQVVAMWNQPAAMRQFVPGLEGSPADASGKLGAIATLVQKNAADYASLYLSVNRLPVFWDFWNPSGEIIAPYLAPFLIAGFLYCLTRLWNGRYLLLIGWFAVTSLPMLLTNNVHAGRLILSVPPMLIMAALGVAMAYSLLRRMVGAWPIVPRLCLAAFLLFIAFDGACDYFGVARQPQTHAKRIADFLGRPGAGGDVYIVTQLSGLEAAELHLYTHREYEFSYLHGGFGTGFALAPAQTPARETIYFYNVQPSAAESRLRSLHEVLSRREHAYVIVDKEVYLRARELILGTMHLDEQTDFLYFFSSRREAPSPTG